MTEVSLNNLQLNKAGRKKTRRLGRGNSSGRGTYSGRGIKGQKARSGVSGLKRRGLTQMLRSKPKMGGFISSKPKMTNINLDELNRMFEAGELITPKKIIAKLSLHKSKSGVKVLGNGQLTKKLKISAHAFSESAKKAIIDAGGSVDVIKRPDNPAKKVKAKKTK